MPFGVCTLSVVPLRSQPADASEMVNQILFGESYQILEERKNWLKIKLQHDNYEGWLDRKQHTPVEDNYFTKFFKKAPPVASDLIEMVTQKDGKKFFPVFLGSLLPGYSAKGNKISYLGAESYHYQGAIVNKKMKRAHLKKYAYLYLHAPYLWGGRSPAGIDCSGFTQMVYRLCGYSLPRDSGQQAKMGQTLSFIEESEPGDLAFFDNAEGLITHVGLILENNYIIHASGKVRLDRLDQTGIFNSQLNQHTHKLRVIKKII
jgi:cell wall-associated NlpC family hydrolase